MGAHGRARRRILLVAAGFLAGIVATAGLHRSQRALAISFWGNQEGTEEAARATPAAQPSTQERVPAATLPDFTRLAEKLSPAVVNISTTSQADAPQFGRRRPFGGRDPHEFWEPFERFFGPLPRRRFKQRSLGSGFIVNRDGVILTNNHVVENADEIVVKLANEKEYKAKVLGRDPKTDIAVIKIDTAADLSPVTLGDSDQLRVGEWVMAIGNPFGLEHSVTAGIVSAKGRFIGQGSYDQFIQTDAAINPGNSGGPLINLKGEVVGINSAIFSRSGGNIGIGFAIPINLAREELPELEEKGKVTRGWLGVLIQKVTPEIADSLGIDEAKGALVADVVKDGPAKAAGMKVGDVIVEFDGHTLKDSTELPLLVARTPVGKTVTVTVIRDKERDTLAVKIGELKEEEVAVSGETERFGLTVQPLTPDIAQSLGLGEEVKGVVVSRVEPGSSGDDAGLRRGDVILEVNRQPVTDLSSYRKALESAEGGKSVLFLVRRGDNTVFLALKPSE
ncbi:MAG: DegQ family serine endoprotease [Candidatus Binatia bacterium]